MLRVRWLQMNFCKTSAHCEGSVHVWVDRVSDSWRWWRWQPHLSYHVLWYGSISVGTVTRVQLISCLLRRMHARCKWVRMRDEFSVVVYFEMVLRCMSGWRKCWCWCWSTPKTDLNVKTMNDPVGSEKSSLLYTFFFLVKTFHLHYLNCTSTKNSGLFVVLKSATVDTGIKTWSILLQFS